MRATEWTYRCVAWVTLALVSGGLLGCKSLSERYIALEVWKYERCFGHLPPGFVPPGAAAPATAQPRICGQNAGCPNGCPPATAGCDSGGQGGGGMVMEGGMPTPAAISAPGGPGLRGGGFKRLFFSGEGFVCQFTGHGKLWIQTRSATPYLSQIHPYRPVQKNNN